MTDILKKDFQQTLEVDTLNASWTLLLLTREKLFLLDISQNVPAWNGFRKLLSDRISTPFVIDNCRTISSSPTEINVDLTMMKNVRKMLYNISQTGSCLTLDESIYEMAKEIQWLVPDLTDLTLRLADFYCTKNFIGVIGKRKLGSGFAEILEQSTRFGSSHVEGT